MTRARCAALALIAAYSFSGAAYGQTANQPAAASQPPPKSATTVQGVTVTPPQAAPFRTRFVQSLNFVQSHGAPSRIGQLARWTDPVCPVTVGLSPAMNAFVSGRVEAVARAVGAPAILRGRCKPNVEILFTSEPQKLLDLVVARRAAYLGYHYAAETRSLAAVTHPIQGWYLSATKGLGGQSLDVASGSIASTTLAANNTQALMNSGKTVPGCAGSRLTHCLSSLFANVLIVADGKALEGRHLGPVADYIAMLVLSQPRSLDGCDALPSILDLTSSGCDGRPAPDALTIDDIAYLKALYRTNLETVYTLEKADVATKMAHDKHPDTTQTH